MKKLNIVGITLTVIALFMVSCEKTPAPVVEIFYEADADDPYTIDFTTTSLDADSFSWDFGDGETGTGDAISHTYAMSGDYSVTVTATGEGGTSTADKEVNIAASMTEMISGGPDASTGKTWVLSRTASLGVDGYGLVDPSFALISMIPNGALDLYDLGVEYDNEYTFFHDGTYSVDNKNGNHLAGWVFASNVIGEANIVKTTDIGIFAVKNTTSTNATWSLTEDTDITVEAVDDDGTGYDGTPKTVTFTEADCITFANGGFIFLEDYATQVFVREATSERITLSIFMHGVYAHSDKPAYLFTLTFDAL